jgi:titin
VKLQWKPPTYDGGSPITGYMVEKRDMKRPTWTNAGKTAKDVTEITVDKLLEGSEYLFRVKAENKKGQSEPCETKAPVVAKSPYGSCFIFLLLKLKRLKLFYFTYA